MKWTKEQIINLIEDHLGDEIKVEDLVSLCFPQSPEIRILDFVDSLHDFELENCEGLFLCGKKHPTAHYRTVLASEGHVFLAYEGPEDATDEELIQAYVKESGAPTKITVEVELLAFDSHERTRLVDIDVEDFESLQTVEDVLNVVYKLGQNDYQSRPMPSVSAGDVIKYQKKMYLVCNIGFTEVDQEFMSEYKKLPQRDRSFHPKVRGRG